MNGLKESFSGIAEKLKADKKLLIIILIGFAGILILLLSETWGKPDDVKPDGEQTTNIQTQNDNEYTYVEDIEKKLGDLIRSIEGAGRTKVMVTLENGVEQVYATQDKTKSSSSSSSEGSFEESLDNENEYIVIKTNDDSETGLIVKIIQPSIRGVAVVCDGADSAVVKQNIVEAVTAVLGISSAKVSVAKMAE
jgi:stage III sporulation protein AG